jgi:hypothetical protein
MRTARKLLVVDRLSGSLVSAMIGPVHAGSDGAIAVAGDDQQRGTSGPSEIDLAGRIERCEGHLKKRSPWRWDDLFLVHPSLFIRGEIVDEPVGKAVEARAEDSPPSSQAQEHWEPRPQGRKRWENPAWGRRVDGDGAGAHIALQQQLRDQTTEGMANQQRRLVQLRSRLLVVIDDIFQADPGKLWYRVLPQFVVRPIVVRPRRSVTNETLGGEE